ncbi:von Willebrand factor type A domain-containing protein [Suillus occidentalis]|nr:von Willebrand factor type A domain-containing protein [Suillus occidentalis]
MEATGHASASNVESLIFSALFSFVVTLRLPSHSQLWTPIRCFFASLVKWIRNTCHSRDDILTSTAACAFELEHADGRVIVGVAKEKSEAATAFQSVVDARKTAGLVEWVTDNLFTISIGSISARKKVTARLTFVMDLLHNGRWDQGHLLLAMAIVERYGEPPAAMLDASTTNEKTIVKITGHSNHHTTEETLIDGFHALGLDKHRCFAEIDPEDRHTIAMQLSLVPNFKIAPLDSQEYIFVIDRGRSMTGAPMETAKHTLEMLLCLLPDSQMTFNIFSFGNDVDGLWGKSVSFDQLRMQHAISSVKGMKANYRGTEIAKAFHFAIASRNPNRNRPTAMFVLTDRDIHASANLDPFTVVSKAVQGCKANAKLRVLTLGIGASVSSDMCEHLAREGEGKCLFAVQAEDFTGKCVMLLNTGWTREIEGVTIDWHGVGSPPAVNFSPSNQRKFLSGTLSPQVGKVVQDLLKLSDETVLEILNHSMETIVHRFKTELPPVALQLTARLCESYLRLAREGLAQQNETIPDSDVESLVTDGDDKVYGAMGDAKTIATVVSCIESSPEILSQVQEVIIPIIQFTLENKLINALVFRLHAISPNMWPVCPGRELAVHKSLQRKPKSAQTTIITQSPPSIPQTGNSIDADIELFSIRAQALSLLSIYLHPFLPVSVRRTPLDQHTFLLHQPRCRSPPPQPRLPPATL